MANVNPNYNLPELPMAVTIQFGIAGSLYNQAGQVLFAPGFSTQEIKHGDKIVEVVQQPFAVRQNKVHTAVAILNGTEIPADMAEFAKAIHTGTTALSADDRAKGIDLANQADIEFGKALEMKAQFKALPINERNAMLAQDKFDRAAKKAEDAATAAKAWAQKHGSAVLGTIMGFARAFGLDKAINWVVNKIQEIIGTAQATITTKPDGTIVIVRDDVPTDTPGF